MKLDLQRLAACGLLLIANPLVECCQRVVVGVLPELPAAETIYHDERVIILWDAHPVLADLNATTTAITLVVARAVARFGLGLDALRPETLVQAMSDVVDELEVAQSPIRRFGEIMAALEAAREAMVVGEAQILSQVKQAYEQATSGDFTGPLTHSAFQTAIRVAKRVTRDTAIHHKRISIPSVAVADFAKQFFERFDDKKIVVIGAGEMGEETLRYLIDEGARQITVVNRSEERAAQLAQRFSGLTATWDSLYQQLVVGDIIVSTTGATEPIVSAAEFKKVIHQRNQRPLLILDLAVPRDFEPAIADLLGVYLYSIDDLRATCEANGRAREKDWPKAERIIDEETIRFMGELHHRATGPTIRRLKAQADSIKAEELARLLNKLTDIDAQNRAEIEHAFERLVGKLLHPPLESLRDEAKKGTSQGLVEALKRLFQLD